MKALKPSHKENKRYLLIEGKDLKKNVHSAIKEFVGILGLSEASPKWIEYNDSSGILSINRESLEKVRGAFSLFKEDLKILRVSGTLKGLEKK